MIMGRGIEQATLPDLLLPLKSSMAEDYSYRDAFQNRVMIIGRGIEQVRQQRGQATLPDLFFH